MRSNTPSVAHTLSASTFVFHLHASFPQPHEHVPRCACIQRHADFDIGVIGCAALVTMLKHMLSMKHESFRNVLAFRVLNISLVSVVQVADLITLLSVSRLCCT